MLITATVIHALLFLKVVACMTLLISARISFDSPDVLQSNMLMMNTTIMRCLCFINSNVYRPEEKIFCCSYTKFENVVLFFSNNALIFQSVSVEPRFTKARMGPSPCALDFAGPVFLIACGKAQWNESAAKI